MLNDIYQSLDPIAFSIGPFDIRWYGLGYFFGFMLAAILALRIARRWEIRLTLDGLLTILIACMVGTVLGGRLGYILFYGQGYYFSHPEEILVFSGMSFHGGLIGFALGGIVAARINRMPIAALADIAGICTPIGLGLVRIANFINGELWGATTTGPWGVVFADGGPLPRHPTQLYEAFLEGFVLLVVLYLLARRKPPLPQGSYFGIFLIGYAVFRIAIEFVRQPDIQIGYLFDTGWVTMGMMLSLPMILVGAGFLFFAAHFRRPQQGQAYSLPEQADPATDLPEQADPTTAPAEQTDQMPNLLAEQAHESLDDQAHDPLEQTGHEEGDRKDSNDVQ